MAINYPGPYEVRIFYNVYNGITTVQHVQRLNVRVDGTPTPGAAMDTIDFLRRDNIPFDAAAEITAWVTLIKTRWTVHANNVITHAELWKYEANSFDASFISTMDLSVAATGSGTTLIAGQEIYTFRTSEGGVMKLSFMETVQAQGAPQSYAALSAGQKAIVDAVRNGTSPWLARDTSYPFAFMRMFPGSNEALFKKVFRQ